MLNTMNKKTSALFLGTLLLVFVLIALYVREHAVSSQGNTSQMGNVSEDARSEKLEVFISQRGKVPEETKPEKLEEFISLFYGDSVFALSRMCNPLGGYDATMTIDENGEPCDMEWKVSDFPYLWESIADVRQSTDFTIKYISHSDSSVTEYGFVEASDVFWRGQFVMRNGKWFLSSMIISNI